jgi:4-hydroxy-3-polyprenylbenzoate decarboxylase
MTDNTPEKRLIIAICGASGSIYGIRLLAELIKLPIELHVIISDAGRQVMAHELGYGGRLPDILNSTGILDRHTNLRLIEHPCDSFFASPASGSFHHDGMAIVPCSMKTIGAIAAGLADNLIHRAADICLKERRSLILAPRETPFSRIHLQNLLRLAEAGAVIVPPSPGFYHHPQTMMDLVNFVVARILDQLRISHTLLKEWGNDAIDENSVSKSG